MFAMLMLLQDYKTLKLGADSWIRRETTQSTNLQGNTTSNLQIQRSYSHDLGQLNRHFSKKTKEKKYIYKNCEN